MYNRLKSWRFYQRHLEFGARVTSHKTISGELGENHSKILLNCRAISDAHLDSVVITSLSVPTPHKPAPGVHVKRVKTKRANANKGESKKCDHKNVFLALCKRKAVADEFAVRLLFSGICPISRLFANFFIRSFVFA